MLIQQLLSENFTPEASFKKLRLADLNSLQRRTLQKLAAGTIDVDSANDQEVEDISGLYSMGLLDDEYNINNIGLKALELIKMSQAREVEAARNRDLARRAPASTDATDVTGDDDQDDVEFPENDDRWK